MYTRTLLTGVGVGYVMDLTGAPCGAVTVLARAETWILPSTDESAVAPAADPTPTTGNQTDYVQLAAGESFTLDLNDGVISEMETPPRRAKIKKLRIWSVAAGMVVAVGN